MSSLVNKPIVNRGQTFSDTQKSQARQNIGAASDFDLQNETSAREAADTQLQSNIDSEASRAEAAESALGERIDGVEGDVEAIDTRLTTAEGDIDNLESSVDALYNTEVEQTDGETSVSSSTSGKVKTFVVGLASAIKTKIEAAYSHISDTVKHITATERTNWNTAYSHSQTEGNPHGTTIEEIDGLRTELTTIESDVSAIEGVIPSEATTSNKLADKSFVNSSIASQTAYFRGTFDIVTDLGLTHGASNTAIATALASVISVVTPNDYTFVIDQDTNGNTLYKRFKYSNSVWQYEYTLNNSSFTASQWASINSGIVEGDVSDLHTHLTDNTRHITAAERTSWNSKASDTALQNEITNRTNADSALGTRIDGVSSDLSTHTSNTTIHVTSTDKSNWNAKATQTDITNAINALDVSDSAVANQFVTKVSETDGKISVSRAQPTIANVSGLQTALNGKAATTHTHSVKINGSIKTIPASGGTPVDLGTYLTSADLSGYLSTKNLYRSSESYGVKFATTTVTSATATSYATYLFSRLQIGTSIGSLSGNGGRPLSGFVQIFQRTNNSAVTTTVTARITVFQPDYTGNIRVYYKIDGQNVDWYIATTTTQQFCAWKVTEVNAYGTVNTLDLVALTSLDGLTEINASYKTPLVDASSTGIGSPTQPVYVDVNGAVQPCSGNDTLFIQLTGGNRTLTANELERYDSVYSSSSDTTTRFINIDATLMVDKKKYFVLLGNNVNLRLKASNLYDAYYHSTKLTLSTSYQEIPSYGFGYRFFTMFKSGYNVYLLGY